MNRRIFLRNTALAAGAVTLPFGCKTGTAPTGKAATTAEIAPFRKSIMWETVKLEGSVLDKCRAIKAAGYDGIQPSSHMNREEVLAALKATGLKASSVCASTHWKKQLSDPDEAVRREGIAGAIVAMEDARAYGTDAILLVPGSVSEQVGYDQCWDRSTAAIRKLVPTAEKLGVTICVENVWNNFLLSPLEACRYIDQFESDYLRFYFDCGNIVAYGWPEQWLRILGHRTKRIHIKEYSRQKADREGRWAGFNVPLTEGDVSWPAVMAEVRKTYTGGWLTTEQGPCKTPEDLMDLSKRLDKIIES